MWAKNLVERIRNKSSMDYTSLGCCALAFVLYLNTLNSGFVYDDRRAVLGNADVSGGAPWLQAFQNDYWGTPLTDSGSHGSYRPLCVLSFRLNFLLGGHTPWGYHLINNLMHVLATGLVVKLARHLLASVWGVLATGALFAAHPIHTEAVAGIVGRADLAACIFFLLTFLAYVRHLVWRERGDARQWPALAAAVLLSWVALLFKETAVTALLVCGLFDALRGAGGVADKNRLRSLCILGAALAATVYCRLVVLPRPQSAFSSADNPVARTHSAWTRLLTFLYLPVFNFRLLVSPQVLSFDWGMDAIPRVASLWDRRNLLSLLFYGALAGVAWRCCRVLLPRHRQPPRPANAPAPAPTHAHSHRKSRTKKKYQDAAASATPAASLHFAPLVKKARVAAAAAATAAATPSCLCRECKHGLSGAEHTSSCRALNNNNNVLPASASASATEYGDCSCHQLLGAGGRDAETPHLFALALHKTAPHLTPRSSRSSSSCSNSTTASSKSSSSSGSHASSSSAASTSSAGSSDAAPPGLDAGRSRFYLLQGATPRTANACVLLTALAFLALPFLPATNLFFYVGFVVAERLLYLPSVGYCLLVGCGVAKLVEPLRSPRQRRRRAALILCMSLALSMLSVRTVRRNLDWRDEESLYRSAVTVNPPKALGNLGSVLSSQARYAEAKEVLLEAIKHRPNMADVHFNLGILHQNQQNFKAAVENFQRAIQCRPNLAVAYLNLGTSLIALGKCQEAARVLQEGATLDGSGVRDRAAHENARMSAYLQLGALYAEQGKLQRALAVYREALDVHAQPAAAAVGAFGQREVLHHRIGDVFARLHQWDEAEKHHRAALAIQPDHVASHLSYGITLARNSSRAAEAELWFKRALTLAPAQASVHHHYAEFLVAQGRAEEALAFRLRAAELAPDDYALVVAAATALRLVERKADAERWYRKAVALRPDDARAHTNLGAILHLLGRSSHAAASYREALRLQPGDPTTLANLAKLGGAEAK